MARLPVLEDPTLAAADRALEQRTAAKARLRPYLGISGAGEACARKVWSLFRWVAPPEVLDAVSIRRIEDGYAGEAMQAERLRGVEGVDLATFDIETGQQIAVSAAAGHVRGHLDGIIRGLVQAPKTPHVWEHKQVNEDKFKALVRLVRDVGEKAALLAWDAKYYVQAQLYMLLSGHERHYLTVGSPGGRATTSARTELDRVEATRLLAHVEGLAFAERPPAKFDESAFECKWCPVRGQCHEGALPVRSCRTCLSSTPTPDGQWQCEHLGKTLTVDEQRAGCGDHLFIPSLLSDEQVDASEMHRTVTYRRRDGSTWVDGGRNAV